MLQLIIYSLTIVITSFYFFPFEFSFLPGYNTKMIMAALGLVILGIQFSQKREFTIDDKFLVVTFWAVVVSMVGFISTVINGTVDYTYATYIISMWVWLGGAYVVIQWIKFIHGYVSIKLLCNYLICVCVFQCLIAIIMDYSPLVKEFIDSFLGSTGFMGKAEGRLYGIGASLDVAGSRFASVLVIIAFLTTSVSRKNKKEILWYLLAFILIAIIGNMISRTTIVGVIISLGYWIFFSGFLKLRINDNFLYLWKLICLLSMILIPICIFLYYRNVNFYENIRFAFEGFFSLVEKGKWEVHSNEILKDMYVFPETFRTWIIGDGYFANPYYSDMNYVGPNYAGYYMQTDAGYLRFIYYFGLLGLLAFCTFMITVGLILAKHFCSYRMMFILLVGVNFIVWLKVSSDIFLVLALFLCLKWNNNCLIENKF